MKGVVFPGDRKVELRDFPDPTPGPGEVVLEIKASGMCGSDLKFYRAAGGAPRRSGSARRAARSSPATSPAASWPRSAPACRSKQAQRRHARDAAPLPRLRRLRALLDRLDAALRRGRRRGLRRDRPRRARALHEVPGADAGAAARRAVVRGGRGDLLRHRHRVGRAAPARPAGRPHHRDLRPGTGRPVGDAAGRGAWARA